MNLNYAIFRSHPKLICKGKINYKIVKTKI